MINIQNLTDENGGHIIQDENGNSFPQRSALKFINATITDDSINDVTEVTVEGGGGGGIALAEPTNVGISNLDEAAVLTWTDPDDIVVDGTTLAAWAGTKIVRKVGSAPTKVTDGVLVVDSKTRNQYSQNGFTDTGLTNGVTYYYGFFPYTTGSGYTYTKTQSFTPSAIYPDAINDLAAVSGYESARLTFSSVQNASGVRLVYGASEPQNETDGTYIDGVTSPYIISNLTNDTQYHVKAYTYNAKSRFRASNDVTVTPSAVKIIVTAENEEFIGQSVTVTGATSQTQTFDSSLELTFEFGSLGTYTVTDGYISSSQEIVASEFKEYDVELSLASITVNVSQSDLYGVTEAKLYKIENDTPTLIATKTINGATTKFSVNTGTYKIGYNNFLGIEGNGLLLNTTNTTSKIANVQAITVSELTNYNVTPSFAKIELNIGSVLEEFLQSIYAFEIIGLTNNSYSFTIPKVFSGSNKTDDVHFYMNMDSGSYDSYGSYCNLYLSYKETSESSWMRYKDNIPGQAKFTYANVVSSTYSLDIDCVKVNIVYDEDFIGKYRYIQYQYDDAATNGELHQGALKSRAEILVSNETIYIKPNDVTVYYNYRIDIIIYDDDVTNLTTASKSATAASGQTVNVSMGLALVQITSPQGWDGETVYFRNETTGITQSATIPVGLVNTFKVKADGTVYTISNSLNSETQTVTASAEQTYDVTMVKGAASATLSKDSITLNSETLSDTFTISNATGSISSVSSSDTDIATATLNGSTVTVSSVNDTIGTAVITINIAESTGYAAGSVTIEVNVEFVIPDLVSWSSGTDDQITAMIDGYYLGAITLADVKSVWSVGDVRNVSLSAMAATGVMEAHRAQTVQMRIIDFDHDTLSTPIGSKTKALITTETAQALNDGVATKAINNTERGWMHNSGTNVGGWRDCVRRTWCNNTCYDAFPAYYKNLIKTVDKISGQGNKVLDTYTTQDKIFILSCIEKFGTNDYQAYNNGWIIKTTTEDGSLYKYYETPGNRLLKPVYGAETTDTSDVYYTRSVDILNDIQYLISRRNSSTNSTYLLSYAIIGSNAYDYGYGPIAIVVACCL